MLDIQQSTVGAWLNRVAREHPDHEALVQAFGVLDPLRGELVAVWVKPIWGLHPYYLKIYLE